MSNHAYIKYITEQLVTYMNKTPTERKEFKKGRKSHATYSNHWLGLFPFAVKTMFKK